MAKPEHDSGHLSTNDRSIRDGEESVVIQQKRAATDIFANTYPLLMRNLCLNCTLLPPPFLFLFPPRSCFEGGVCAFQLICEPVNDFVKVPHLRVYF